MLAQTRRILIATTLFWGLSALGAEGGNGPVAVPATATSSAAAAPAPTAAEVSERVNEMETEIERLRSEVTELRKQLNASPETGTSQPVTTATLAQPAPGDTPAAATPAEPAATTPPPDLAAIMGPLNITGFVDGFLGYDFNHPSTVVPSVPAGNFAATTKVPRVSGFRAFEAPDRQFALNLAEFIVSKAPAAESRLGFNLAFGFGNAMNVVNSTDPGTLAFSQYLKEGYLSYLAPVGKGLQVDFGKFVTPFGAEVIESKDNWNYSRGLLFTYAIPFYHFGARAKYVFNDKASLTGFLVNGWNNIIENNTGKSYGFSLGLNPGKKFSIVQNYMTGPEQPENTSRWRQMTDTVVTWNASNKLTFMTNFDYGRDHPVGSDEGYWTGIAGYLRYALTDKVALATRYEYYNDHSGFTTLQPQHLHSATGTLERKIAGHLLSRLEYRWDGSNRDAFTKGSRPVDTQQTLLGGIVYTFDFKELK
jgi:Putative beta-barrel porin-2, OmpL-like. bbp2